MSLGFFALEDKPKRKKSSSGVGKNELLKLSTPACGACGLCNEVRTPKMPPSGKGELKTLIIAEAPGQKEDFNGVQLVGEAGTKLRSILRKFGLDLDRHFWKTNAVICRPTTNSGANRTPTQKEIFYCRPNLVNAIRELQPRFIFLMGGVAIQSFFADRSGKIVGGKDKLSAERWRGLRVADPVNGAWVFPMNHPSFISRVPDAEHVLTRDIKHALDQLDLAPPNFPDYRGRVRTATAFKEVRSGLFALLEGEYLILSVDYECTTLKPFWSGSKLVSAAIGYVDSKGTVRSFAFPVDYQDLYTEDQREEIKDLLYSLQTKKGTKWVAQNIQMEEKWNRGHLGFENENWAWDTMQAAHVEDERKKYCNLDFLVFKEFGIEYGEDVEAYKRPVNKSPYNSMDAVPLQNLLGYNGLDALFTLELYHKQQASFGEDEFRGYKEITAPSIRSFCKMEQVGIKVNVDYYKEQEARLSNQFVDLEEQLRETDEIKLFKKKYGKWPKLTGKSKDIQTVFFKLGGYEPLSRTETGQPQLDSDFLKANDTHLSHLVLRYRRTDKLLNTYLRGFLREIIDGYLYPNFNLHLTRTYRSSSDRPNFQNIPKRDEEGKKLIRSGIIPRPGHRLMPVDYGSMEVRIIAALSGDPTLCYEVEHDVDFHAEFRDRLGLGKWNEDTKAARHDAKNAFTFPLFYGSYFKSIARDLVGRGYQLSEHFVKQVEDEFWKKYRGVKTWQEGLFEYYRKNGHVMLAWGHKRRGFLTRSKIINTPVQGSAFQCLLWALNYLNSDPKFLALRALIPGQIHDELFLDVPEGEEKETIKVVTHAMVTAIREHNPWLRVPLMAEWSATEVDESWPTVKDIIINQETGDWEWKPQK